MRTGFLPPLVLLACALAASPARAIEATIGDIVDARSSGKIQGRLEIELKVIGDEVADVAGLRASVIGAVDETGRDVNDALRSDKQTHYANAPVPEKSVRIYLKSPSRRATVLKELIGRLDLFMPKLDPESTVIIDDVASKTGAPLELSMLKNAGVEATVLTKMQYDQLGKSQKGSSASGTLVGISGLDDRSMIFKLNDPESRVVSIEFQTESGEKIRQRGTTSVGNFRVFAFTEALPPKARVKMEVATLKSVVRVPFDFENVQLP